MWHLLASTPTDGVFLPVLCTGQPCVSSLDSQGTSHSLVHLTMRAACVVKDSGTLLVFFEGQDPSLSIWLPNYDRNTAPRVARKRSNMLLVAFSQ